MTKQKIALALFIIVAAVDIIGIMFKIPSLVIVFKPLILLSLVTLYLVSVSEINKIYVLALIFSFLGDVFLMFNGELYFTIGLVSFLIAHLFFIKIVSNRLHKTSVLNIIFSVLPFLILLLFLLFFLKNYLDEMLIPVLIYGITISTFGVVSMLDYLNTKSNKSLLMFVGAIIFISSDSILAINKFYSSTAIFAVLIMLTYIVAQFLIYKSEIQK
ncbi:lysoplasmalogenase [Lutibacter sp.]|uniref:lysoplasmalogenase n=1 Tax=Lutibacter sp. TaxID=1925666 RepID=UPI002735B379|nr:lysoplasmalogenase [Lutibacter sp.]MDP3312015.1 lysoplasmalogenase [Lutibacter sp.]